MYKKSDYMKPKESKIYDEIKGICKGRTISFLFLLISRENFGLCLLKKEHNP